MASFINGPIGFFPTRQTQFPGFSPLGAGRANDPQATLITLLQALLGALTQLNGGWNNLAGPQQPQPQPTTPINYGGPTTPTPTTGGGYGGVATGTTASPEMFGTLRPPSDPNDFASYLQAQLAGGTLQGNTGIAQADAIPGTRFARVQSPQLWHADVARNYAYQFAAFASGNDALSVGGLQAGVEAFHQMKPEARLFMQVASVFKGNSLNGPGFYDNPGLKNLLLSKGVSDLAGLDGVGQTDVQTIGAVAKAIDRGQLNLNDIINSGTIDNLDRYFQVIDYVQTGRFSLDVAAYDTTPI